MTCAMDVCLFNGAIRNNENEHMAHLLRSKAKVLVPLAHAPMRVAYRAWRISTAVVRSWNASSWRHPRPTTRRTHCPDSLPCARRAVDDPKLDETVRTLGQVERVDYYVPGCPPQAPQSGQCSSHTR